MKNKEGELVENYAKLNEGEELESIERSNLSEQKSVASARLLTKSNLERVLSEKYKKYGLIHDNFGDNMTVLNNSLEDYLKDFIEELVKVSRMRNSNLSLLGKAADSEGVNK